MTLTMKKSSMTTMTTMAIWNKSLSRLTAAVLLCLTLLTAVAQVPPRPNPPRLVNDFAGVLGDCQWLEDSLQKIAMETSNQICVVTMSDLGGFSPNEMATEIGDKWGVGKSDKDNGVVILIKPKTNDSKGEAYIAPGRGLEGVITDATSRRIVDNHMIPYFKENDYLDGVWAGVQTVRSLATGEYNEEDYAQDDDGALFGLIMFIIIMALFLYLASKSNQGNNGDRNNRDTGTWGGPIIFTSGNDWGRGGSSWSGGGSWGGGGGWGGFGGGSFGGGGGGGSW